MDTQEENEKTSGNKLSLIYKTDSFGFPLHQADEEAYIRDMEKKKAESESFDLDIPGSDLDDQEEDY